MIFQQFQLLAQRNVLQNVCFPLELQGMDKKKREEKEINQSEMVPSTIVIPSNKLEEKLTEKVLENLIIDNISEVMGQLGEGYCLVIVNS